MNVFLIYTNNSLYNILIGKVTILAEEPKVLIENCYWLRFSQGRSTKSQIPLKCELIPFPLFSKENSLLINSSNIFTLVEPTEEILSLYFKNKSQGVILNE